MTQRTGQWLFRTFMALLLTLGSTHAQSSEDHQVSSNALYMANEGLMVTQGDTKVLFDPLFRHSAGQYQLLPAAMKEALFAGSPPFDGVDAVFISHYHGDHFSPDDILRLLKQQPGIRLYAPPQAVEGIRDISVQRDESVLERITAVDLAYKDAPVTLDMENLLIEAVRIPHSGWPIRRLDVENISWRVTLNESTTVVHMGDADANDVHFARDAPYWEKRKTHMAFPPYWFFDSTYGPGILKNRVRADHNVGIHVPVSMPDEPARRPKDLQGYDLFTEPGETREIRPAASHDQGH